MTHMVRLQGEGERLKGIYYEYNPQDIPLGEGGMGKVYKGWCCNERTGQRREVAIKFLYSDLPSHVIERARRESAVQLRNDNLIEMLGFVEIKTLDELGQAVIRYHVVSEYLHGVTLDQLLNGNITDHRGTVIPFAQELYGKKLNDPYHFALIVIRNLLSGLMALHDAGYIHRDIDPSNIMITSNGKIKLIDFGISKKTIGQNTKESSYTVDGQFIGKPKYAAPELVRGLVDSQSNVTDLYAVGILLYQLVTGNVPFEGEMAEVLEMQLNKKIPYRNIAQKQLRTVIKTATQKKRSLRYQSAAEFRVAVDRLVPLSYPQKTPDIRLLAGVGSVAAVAAIVLALIFPNKSPDPDDFPVDEQSAKVKITSKDEPTYTNAVRLLSGAETARRGLDMLETLAEKGDYQSLFLLSRLYYDGAQNVRVDNSLDDVPTYQRNLGLNVDNKKAHRLLQSAVSVNDEDYHSLYELGLDFKSKLRGTDVNEDSARYYLNKAKTEARKNGDTLYEKAINERLGSLQ